MSKMKRSDWSSRNPIPQTAIDKFHEKVNALAKREFGTDDCGECPVEVRVTDRTRYSSNRFMDVPYTHGPKWDGPEILLSDVLQHMDILNVNVSIAHNATSNFMTMMRHWKRNNRIKA